MLGALLRYAMPPSWEVAVVRDVGMEPILSRLKGDCIALSANPANSGGWLWKRTSLVSIKSRVHLPSLPVTHVQQQNGAGCWNRTNASRLSTAGSTFELILHGAPFGS